MHITIGYRESFPCLTNARLTLFRHFFPSTEPEAEEDWEEVEGGESAENGPAANIGEAASGESTNKISLPDVPTAEPMDDGHASKKQKQDDEEKF